MAVLVPALNRFVATSKPNLMPFNDLGSASRCPRSDRPSTASARARETACRPSARVWLTRSDGHFYNPIVWFVRDDQSLFPVPTMHQKGGTYDGGVGLGVNPHALRNAVTDSAGAWSPDRAISPSGVVISAGRPAAFAAATSPESTCLSCALICPPFARAQIWRLTSSAAALPTCEATDEAASLAASLAWLQPPRRATTDTVTKMER